MTRHKKRLRGFKRLLRNVLRATGSQLEKWADQLEAQVARVTTTLPGDVRRDLSAKFWRIWLRSVVFLRSRLFPFLLTILLGILLFTVSLGPGWLWGNRQANPDQLALPLAIVEPSVEPSEDNLENTLPPTRIPRSELSRPEAVPIVPSPSQATLPEISSIPDNGFKQIKRGRDLKRQSFSQQSNQGDSRFVDSSKSETQNSTGDDLKNFFSDDATIFQEPGFVNGVNQQAEFSEEPPNTSGSDLMGTDLTVEKQTAAMQLAKAIETLMIEAIQDLADNLVRSVQPDFSQSRITIELTETWCSLTPQAQSQAVAQMLKQAQKLDFTQLEITDSSGHDIARNAVIGTQMIIYDLCQPHL